MDSLVIELVFGHMQLKHLLNCRLVNLTWNNIATRILNDNGWKVRLLDRPAKEYLKLLDNRLELDGDRGLQQQMANLQLIFATYLYTDAGLDSFMKIYDHPTNPVVTALHFEPGHSMGEQFMAALITQNATTVQEIIFRQSDPPKYLTLPDEIQFPDLKSFHYTSSSTLGDSEPPPKMLAQILGAAPNLKVIEVYHLLPPTRARASARPSLFGIEAVSTLTLRNLLQLGIFLPNLNHLKLLERLQPQFDRLMFLKVSLLGMQLLPALAQFIERNCPCLGRLEITDVSDHKHMNENQARLDPAVPNNLLILPKLPTVTHFGFRMRNKAIFGGVFEINHGKMKMMANATAIFSIMNGCVNLKTVSIDVDGVEALALIMSNLSHVADAANQRKFPGVTVMILNVSGDSGTSPDIVDTTPHLVNQLYPNLEKVVINLRATHELCIMKAAGMVSALGLIFGLDSVKKANVNNFYARWIWNQEVGILGMEYIPCNPNSKLVSLTFRDVRVGETHRARPLSKTLFPKLLEIVPGKSDLVVYADADVAHLLQSGGDKSYEEWATELGRLVNPKVVLL